MRLVFNRVIFLGRILSGTINGVLSLGVFEGILTRMGWHGMEWG